MNSLILSGFLAIGQPSGQALPDQDASRYAAKALYKQLGLDKSVKRLEKTYVKGDLKKYGGYLGLGIRIATEKRISYTWRF